uniref:Uncharacterized protein n=1 Tax=Arundo donax TaxID=35708 RepID=A0A0A8Y268_ARUDO
MKLRRLQLTDISPIIGEKKATDLLFANYCYSVTVTYLLSYDIPKWT